ncbi:leucyl aminopeptidase, partial [Salmonella enterica subsp. enterica serovar Goldcoast]
MVVGEVVTCGGGCEPEAVSDVATVAGGCVGAVGHHSTGLVSNESALADE